ncbi:porin family protein [Soonwooa sp.]|uniref:porin family protein n=1 Tax=Soonwooa sp. TaxID=1938592 RepID=UPI00260B8413|nr:porin family protein [Soonwooa sp.]
MKKILIGTAFSLAAMMQAQIDFSATRFGITAGATYSRIQNAHNPSGPRYSMFIGALGLTPIDSDDQFYIQTEVLYFGAGEGGDKSVENKNGWAHAVYANNYLSIPVSFKGYFSESESEFFGLIGPRFDFLINQNNKNIPPGREDYAVDRYGKGTKFNLGVGAGIGYSYKRQLEITARYDVHLMNVYPDMKNSPIELATSDPSVAKKKNEHIINVGIAYIFK